MWRIRTNIVPKKAKRMDSMNTLKDAAELKEMKNEKKYVEPEKKQKMVETVIRKKKKKRSFVFRNGKSTAKPFVLTIKIAERSNHALLYRR